FLFFCPSVERRIEKPALTRLAFQSERLAPGGGGRGGGVATGEAAEGAVEGLMMGRDVVRALFGAPGGVGADLVGRSLPLADEEIEALTFVGGGGVFTR